jgi:hypothetical protein
MAAAPKTVTLVDRQGGECNVSSPADVVNLVFGQGYKVKGNQTPDEAAAFLLEQGSAAEALAQVNTVTSDKGK